MNTAAKPKLSLAQDAKDAKAEAALANWEAFMQEPPIDVDFRALCPPSNLNARDEQIVGQFLFLASIGKLAPA